jgi:MFS family permease
VDNRFVDILKTDALKLILAISVMSFSNGYLVVVQSIYLNMLGFSPFKIGLIMMVTSISGSLRAALYGFLADRVGRKPVLMLDYFTAIPFFIIYLFSKNYIFFLLAGCISGTGAIGYGGVVHRALLAEKSDELGRTRAFSIQYFSSSGFATVGTILSGLPELLQSRYYYDAVNSIKTLYLLGILLVICAISLVYKIEESRRESPAEYLEREGVEFKYSWGLIGKFLVIYLFYGMGAGIIMPFFSLWFYLRYGVGIKTIGYIFTASKAVETLTYLIGPPIASRFGIVKTIVATRYGGAICVALLPFAQNPIMAGLLYTGRNAIQHISLPLRQSYMMARVKPRERASAAGIIEFTSATTRSIANSLGGYLLQEASLILPIYISAFVFATGNTLYYIFFKKDKLPEETV